MKPKVGMCPRLDCMFVSMGVDVIYWPALCEGIPTPSSITISVFLPPPSSGHWRPRIRSDTRYCFGSLLRLRCTQSLPPSPSLPLHISARCVISAPPSPSRVKSLPSLSLSMWVISVLPCAKEGNLTRLRRAFYHCRSVQGACGNWGC